MENPGLVTFRDEFVYRSAVTDTERQTRAMVIAHEMAHMWFGDLVTLAWWDDIWLNESFAEYMGYQTLTEATRFTDTWVDFGVARKGWGYDADQRPSTHPVAPDPDAVPDTASALLNFDGISYAKGASALRQLVAWLGEKDFLAGINAHFARHKFANATLADFIDNLASATDRDVHAWAGQWLRTTGIDTLTAETGTPRPPNPPAPRRTATASPGPSPSPATAPCPHRITVGAYDHALGTQAGPGRLALRDRFEIDVPGDRTPTIRPGRRPCPRRPQRRRPHLRQDPPGHRLLGHRPHQPLRHPLTPSPGPSCGTPPATWSATATLAPATYLATARTHLPYETDLALVQGVLSFAAGQVVDRCTIPRGPARRPRHPHRPLPRPHPPHRGRLTAGPAPHRRTPLHRRRHPARHAPQLARRRHRPRRARARPELRWRILTRLAVLGATDEAAIATELAADPSATGREGAARCRAALPTPEAKAAAWDALFTDDTLSNYLFTATAQGFWQPGQEDVTGDYVSRFYPDAIALAARRGPAIAEAAGRYAFPVYAVDPESLGTGLRALEDPALTPALRRKLVDQLDDLRRALAVRTSATG